MVMHLLILIFAVTVNALPSGSAANIENNREVSAAILQRTISVRGQITSMKVEKEGSGTKRLGVIQVDGKKEADTDHDRATVTVTDQTRIFIQRGEQRAPATFVALKVGQRIEASFTGPVRESYPVQADAGEITILEEKK